MKKILLAAILTLAGSLLFNSCSDSFLDVKPTTLLPGDGYTSETIESALIAAYQPLQWYDLWMPLPFIAEAMGDDIRIGGGSTSDQEATHDISRYNAKAVNHSDAIWSSSYEGIFRANIVINVVPEMDMDAQKKDQLIAEAYALRSFYYFQIWRFYGNIVYFDNNPVDIVNEWTNIKQYTVEESYNKIMADIDKALEGTKLQETVPAGQNGRFTKAAAQMLKAHMVMMKADQSRYPEILTDLTTIISSGKYTLYPDFEKIWEDEGEWCSESIFEINYTDRNSTRGWSDLSKNPGGTVFPSMIGINGFNDKDVENPKFDAGWGFMPIEPHLYELFEDTDQRKNASIFSFEHYKKTVNTKAEYDTTRWDDTGHFNKKYLPRKGGNAGSPAGHDAMNFRNNLRVFRIADTYLLASELLVRTGGNQGKADEYLNAVRGRAYKNAGSYQKVATLDNLLAERRLEFACEGHRFFDLIRFGKEASLTKTMQTGWENISETQRRRIYGTFTYSPSKRYFPIPQSEVDRSLGALIQNTGY